MSTHQSAEAARSHESNAMGAPAPRNVAQRSYAVSTILGRPSHATKARSHTPHPTATIERVAPRYAARAGMESMICSFIQSSQLRGLQLGDKKNKETEEITHQDTQHKFKRLRWACTAPTKRDNLRRLRWARNAPARHVLSCGYLQRSPPAAMAICNASATPR